MRMADTNGWMIFDQTAPKFTAAEVEKCEKEAVEEEKKEQEKIAKMTPAEKKTYEFNKYYSLAGKTPEEVNKMKYSWNG